MLEWIASMEQRGLYESAVLKNNLNMITMS